MFPVTLPVFNYFLIIFVTALIDNHCLESFVNFNNTLGKSTLSLSLLNHPRSILLIIGY